MLVALRLSSVQKLTSNSHCFIIFLTNQVIKHLQYQKNISIFFWGQKVIHTWGHSPLLSNRNRGYPHWPRGSGRWACPLAGCWSAHPCRFRWCGPQLWCPRTLWDPQEQLGDQMFSFDHRDLPWCTKNMVCIWNLRYDMNMKHVESVEIEGDHPFISLQRTPRRHIGCHGWEFSDHAFRLISIDQVLRPRTAWWFFATEKDESQLGFLLPVYRKIQHVPNHKPDWQIWLLSNTDYSQMFGWWIFMCH